MMNEYITKRKFEELSDSDLMDKVIYAEEIIEFNYKAMKHTLQSTLDFDKNSLRLIYNNLTDISNAENEVVEVFKEVRLRHNIGILTNSYKPSAEIQTAQRFALATEMEVAALIIVLLERLDEQLGINDNFTQADMDFFWSSAKKTAEVMKVIKFNGTKRTTKQQLTDMTRKARNNDWLPASFDLEGNRKEKGEGSSGGGQRNKPTLPTFMC